jgi:hypothetical protein
VNGVRLPKEPALAVEAFAELLWIVNHTGGMIGHYYKLPVSRTTSFTTSELVEEPLTNPSAAVQGVSA